MSNDKKILIIDDEKNLLEVMKIGLKEEGYSVKGFTDPVKALKEFDRQNYSGVITDIRMPEMSGIEVLNKCKDKDPRTVVLLITAYSSVESAIEAIQGGADDYISKPFRVEELVLRLQEALERSRMEEMNVNLRKEKLEEFKIVGKSEKIERVKQKIKKVAEVNSPVLIFGESGTGKELVANLIHYKSRRPGKFVPVNCSAFPSELLESELFGYKKGAFTGANRDKKGLFVVANRGTLFLDEISTLPMPLQPKLLRVIQTMEFTPLGATEPRKVDVRILTATNRNLEKLVNEGSFRKDLFYRLNVIPIRIPSLSERKEDIPLLVDHFIEKISSRLGIRKKRVSDGAMKKLVNYDWHGNVRELENLLERLIVLEDKNEIKADSIPMEKEWKKEIEEINLENLEEQAIRKALEKTGGNKRRAAELLGIHLSTLYRKMNKLDI